MRKKSLLVLTVLLMLYIGPMIFLSSYGHTAVFEEPNIVKEFQVADSWYSESWQYRRNIPITGSAGAGTFYQVQVVVSYDAKMQTDFDDILFTDDDGSTLLDHWREVYVPSGYAIFWIEVIDDLDSNQNIKMYYGNAGATSASNGTNTFLFFDDFENNNMDRWDKVGAYWSTVSDRVRLGSYSAFGDADAIGADRWLHTNSFYDKGFNDSDVMVHLWAQTELETSKEYLFRSSNVTPGPGIAYSLVGDQNDWYYDNGPYDMWEANTYLDDTWFEVELALDFTNDLYRLWIDSVSKGSQDLEDTGGVDITHIESWELVVDSSANEDMWIDDCYIRNYVFAEPVVGAFGSEEDFDDFRSPHWEVVGTAILLFSVAFDYWAFNMILIFGGLVLMIVSVCMMAVKVRDRTITQDSGMLLLFLFCVGWGLFIGGTLIG